MMKRGLIAVRDIKDFKNIHNGKRCIIIGTGPSLNKMNWDILRGEILFGCNTLFRGFEKYGISCEYYGIADGPFLTRHLEVLQIETVLFMPNTVYNYCFGNPNRFEWRSSHPLEQNNRDRKSLERIPKDIKFRDDLIVLRSLGVNKGYSSNMEEGMACGGTVIFDINLQVAHYMGFKEVLLIGCDCDYTKSPHFDGAPPDRVLQMTAGKPQLTFEAYKNAKRAYEKDNRRIYNCTPGGKLEIFERRKLEDVLGK